MRFTRDFQNAGPSACQRTCQHACLALFTVALGIWTPVLAHAQDRGQDRGQDRDQDETQNQAPITCTPEAETMARERYERAEAFKTLNKHAEAAAEYHAAFAICARPFLLFNAGRMHWLNGELESALALYENYLEMAPEGRAAPMAREQIFAAAEAFRERGDHDLAVRAYERYLELAPEGENVIPARFRAAEIRAAQEEERAEAERAEAERRRDEERAAEEREPAAASTRRAEESARPERRAAGERTTDWKPFAVAGAGAAIAVLGGVLHGQAMNQGQEFDERVIERCSLQGCLLDSIPDLDAMLEGARSKQRLAIAAYAVGGAVVAAGVTWYLVQRSRTPSAREAPLPTTAFTPLVAPGFVGTSWHVRF